MILVDTSVWVDHLRAGERQLTMLLERAAVPMHPMVLGELACGNLRARAKLINLWQNLPALAPATDAEALCFLDLNRLWGRGIGYVDLHLLTASALAPGTLLWTRDKRLAEVAAGLNLAYFE